MCKIKDNRLYINSKNHHITTSSHHNNHSVQDRNDETNFTSYSRSIPDFLPALTQHPSRIEKVHILHGVDRRAASAARCGASGGITSGVWNDCDQLWQLRCSRAVLGWNFWVRL